MNVNNSRTVRRISAAVVILMASAAGLIIKHPSAFRAPEKADKQFTGQVVDKHTRLPIANVDITLLGSGVPPLRVTDNNGAFNFPLDKLTSVIQIEAVADGYQVERLTVSPSETTCYIELPPVSQGEDRVKGQTSPHSRGSTPPEDASHPPKDAPVHVTATDGNASNTESSSVYGNATATTTNGN